jgi:hypothetical protein
VTFKPICPGPPNRRRQNKVIPEVEKSINVDKAADVLFGAFSKHLFIHTGSICSISQVVGERGAAPSDVEWQLDLAGCPFEIGILDVIRDRHRARCRPEGQTSGASHA